ncbi:DUF6612 family protein [Salibacterium halotolerans]|uniref:Lipoprotein n=1 Tax=Salibacterium halotolerans TaxID=1884432 RepID=A0A1I5XWH1_9BACI|nr:DUF6612 family protein [Salibacterium halotolerans]SFQ36321.1 hypothetical protein SAMN05518683_13221 [Salibacterium halotolerans]
MKSWKKAAGLAVGSVLLLLSACGDRELPEEVYGDALETMENLDSVYFTESNTLNAAEEGVSTFTRGAIRYGDPIQGYMESSMNLVELDTPVELDIRVDGENIQTRQNGEWEASETNTEQIQSMLRPNEDLSFFLEFKNEFLMKEVTDVEDTDDYYEVSFKGTEERHKVLAEKKLSSLGVMPEGGLSEEQLNGMTLDGIEMTAFIDKETRRLNGYDTRFTFTVELGGKLRSFDEQTNVRYEDHNNVEGNLEEFIQQKVQEIQQEQMEEQESENNADAA